MLHAEFKLKYSHLSFILIIYEFTGIHLFVSIELKWTLYAVAPIVSINIFSPYTNIILLGTRVELECTTSVGSPPIMYTWLTPNGSNATYIASNFESFNISLIVTNYTDYGNYTCFASNSIGSDMKFLTLLTPPSKNYL